MTGSRTNPRRWRTVTTGAALAALCGGLLAAAPASMAAGAALPNPVSSVDPFIGTQDNTAANTTESAYGDTSPGATTPFGMVNFNPNTYNTKGGSQTNQGGYEYDADQIRGFSLNRVSGTGCATHNGAEDFPIFPYAGALTNGQLPTSPGSNIKAYYTAFSHDKESASPGSYQVTLDNGIDSELTATPRTADARFTFPSDGSSATLLFDAAGSINGTEGSDITVTGDDTVEGTTTVQATCKQGVTYTAHFSAHFSQPFTTAGTWQGGTVTPVPGLSGTSTASASSAAADGAGAYVGFAPGSTVQVSIGLSYVSVADARLNEQQEAAGRSFDSLRTAARDRWSDALGHIAVTPSTTGTAAAAQLTTFYTALYHSMQQPGIVDDVNGVYQGYDGKPHTVRSGHHEYMTFSGWDVYRGEAQLIALLFPDRASDINQSLTDMGTQVGWYNWPMINAGQNKMPGDSLASVLASMDAFGATDYDRTTALKSLASAQQLLPNGTAGASSDGVPSANHRAGFQQYASLGFLPESSSAQWPTSTTLEYAVDDFGIAQLAARLGDTADEKALMTRAQNWRNVFDPVSGTVVPRAKTGFDRATDLSKAGSQFSEASGDQYAFMVPQNVAGLVAAKGGAAAVEQQLDTFFSNFAAGATNTNPGHDSPYAYMSNEIDAQDPELYDWIGRPDRTAEVNQAIRDALWSDNDPDGLYGNDDLGGLSSWYVWSSIGLFPAVFGRSELVVSGPAFSQVNITRSGGHAGYTISAPKQSHDNRYVTGMTVGGHAQSATWLPESFAQSGGKVTFTMASKPNAWGTNAADAPPSFNTGSDDRNDVGSAPAGQGSLAGFDASGNSYVSGELPAAGAQVALPGTAVTYQWPSTAAGQPDNWVPHGQTVAMGGVHASSVSFLGAATNGPSTGVATVHYTDGSTQQVTVALDDWTTPKLPSGTDTAVVTTGGRNNVNGSKDTSTAYVYGTAPQSVDSAKAISSVTLPASTDAGVMHVFAVGTAPANG